MATIQRPKTPIDETLWRDQVWYRQWGPLTELTVMDYFRMSTFFDHTSNNGTLFQQMMFNPQFREELRTPELFNDRLKTMTGVEYMLAAGSAESGVWVIRKQLRGVPRWDENLGVEAEDLTVLAAYYVVGENIFQAPSVVTVLQNRMLTTITALRSALSVATKVSLFAPTSTSSSTATATTSTTTSAAASQQPSLSQSQSLSQQRTASLPPPSTQSSTAALSMGPSSTPHSSSSSLANDPRVVTQALSLSLKYKNEYLDDHAPLLGDPGSFLQAQQGSQRGSTPGLGIDAAKKGVQAAAAAGMKGAAAAGASQMQSQQPAKKKGKGLAG